MAFYYSHIIMIMYYVIFTKIKTDNINDYWTYLASGIFQFNFMINNLIIGMNCIVNNANHVKKMYFPREILVLSQVLSTFIVTVLSYFIVIVVVFITAGINNLLLILAILIELGSMSVFVIGYTLIFSAITVYVRDISHFIGSISMIFYFMILLYFTLDSVSNTLRNILMMNPFTYFVELFHTSAYYGSIHDSSLWIVCSVMTGISIVLGIVIFIKLKKGFVERL